MTQQFYSRSIQAVPNLKKHWLTGLKYFSWEVLQFKKKKNTGPGQEEEEEREEMEEKEEEDRGMRKRRRKEEERKKSKGEGKRRPTALLINRPLNHQE